MKPCQVLVVDDDPLVRFFLHRALVEGGFRVLEAANGAAASHALKKRPGLILLDVRLPDADGLELLSRFRRALPAALVVVMTSHATPRVRSSARERGASGFIPKPFRDVKILALVRRVLGRAPRGRPPRSRAAPGVPALSAPPGASREGAIRGKKSP